MKIFNIIFLVLFLISAGLQYNDPDPALWILIYIIGALGCYFAIKKQNYPRLTLVWIIFLSIYAVYLFFDKDGVLTWLINHHAENIAGSMKASSPWIEETREFFGLMILITVSVIDFFVLNKEKIRSN